MSDSPQRHFRLSEVRAALPDVDARLGEMQQERKRAAEARALLDSVRRSGTTNGNGASADNGELRSRFRRHAERLQALAAELESMGVQVKDLERGLVDWPAQRNGSTVLLCWLRGEPDVAWWHDLHAGFPGRQAIVEEEWD